MVGEEECSSSEAANPQKRRSFAAVKGKTAQKAPARPKSKAGSITDASENTEKVFSLRSTATTTMKNAFVEGSGSETASKSAALNSCSNPPKPRTRSQTTPKSVALGSSRSPANSKANSNSNAKAKRTRASNKGGN